MEESGGAGGVKSWRECDMVAVAVAETTPVSAEREREREQLDLGGDAFGGFIVGGVGGGVNEVGSECVVCLVWKLSPSYPSCRNDRVTREMCHCQKTRISCTLLTTASN